MKDRKSIFPSLLGAELEKACEANKPLNSAHEAYAVILEELDEFWEEVRKKAKNRDQERMLAELVQIGAMCQRTAEDLGLLRIIPGTYGLTRSALQAILYLEMDEHEIVHASVSKLAELIAREIAQDKLDLALQLEKAKGIIAGLLDHGRECEECYEDGCDPDCTCHCHDCTQHYRDQAADFLTGGGIPYASIDSDTAVSTLVEFTEAVKEWGLSRNGMPPAVWSGYVKACQLLKLVIPDNLGVRQ